MKRRYSNTLINTDKTRTQARGIYLLANYRTLRAGLPRADEIERFRKVNRPRLAVSCPLRIPDLAFPGITLLDQIM
jgi:hypothetical protein